MAADLIFCLFDFTFDSVISIHMPVDDRIFHAAEMGHSFPSLTRIEWEIFLWVENRYNPILLKFKWEMPSWNEENRSRNFIECIPWILPF